MKLEIFSILDKATGAFDKPIFMLTKAEAIRAFTQEVNNAESMFHKHPLDYHLYHVGTFYQDTATFEQEGVIDLGSAKTFQNPDNTVQFPAKEVTLPGHKNPIKVQE